MKHFEKKGNDFGIIGVLKLIEDYKIESESLTKQCKDAVKLIDKKFPCNGPWEFFLKYLFNINKHIIYV